MLITILWFLRTKNPPLPPKGVPGKHCTATASLGGTGPTTAKSSPNGTWLEERFDETGTHETVEQANQQVTI